MALRQHLVDDRFVAALDAILLNQQAPAQVVADIQKLAAIFFFARVQRFCTLGERIYQSAQLQDSVAHLAWIFERESI